MIDHVTQTLSICMKRSKRSNSSPVPIILAIVSNRISLSCWIVFVRVLLFPFRGSSASQLYLQTLACSHHPQVHHECLSDPLWPLRSLRK